MCKQWYCTLIFYSRKLFNFTSWEVVDSPAFPSNMGGARFRHYATVLFPASDSQHARPAPYDGQNNGKLSDLNYCTTTGVITVITICDHGALLPLISSLYRSLG